MNQIRNKASLFQEATKWRDREKAESLPHPGFGAGFQGVKGTAM